MRGKIFVSKQRSAFLDESSDSGRIILGRLFEPLRVGVCRLRRHDDSMFDQDLLEIDGVCQLDDVGSGRGQGAHGFVDCLARVAAGSVFEKAPQTPERTGGSPAAGVVRRSGAAIGLSPSRGEQELKIFDGLRDRPDVIQAGARGKTPAVEMRPWVGFMPATPQKDAGRVIEPPVWLPTAPKHIPEATAAAEPLEEPPGVRSRFQGLRVIGGSIQAYGVVTVLPRITAPDFRRLATTCASFAATRSARARRRKPSAGRRHR